jgi:hypothetical protein
VYDTVLIRPRRKTSKDTTAHGDHNHFTRFKPMSGSNPVATIELYRLGLAGDVRPSNDVRYIMTVWYKRFADPLKVVILVKTNLKTQARVILCG